MADHRIIVAGVVLRDNKSRYLLVQEKRSEVRGLWNLPAGHVDKGETIQQAAIRETQEEVGISVKLSSDKPILIDAETEPGVKKYAFSAEPIDGSTLSIDSEELMDAKWLHMDDIKELYNDNKLRSPWVINSVLAIKA